MRHRKRTVKLNRTSSHRTAMLRNLVCSLIKHEKVQTTKAKAKAARTLADKVIHLAIGGKETATRRRVFQLLDNKEAVKLLFDERAGQFSKNNGGYTRIVPYSNNLGDNAETVFFMLAYEAAEKEKSKATMRFHFTKKKKAGRPKKSEVEAEAAEVEADAAAGAEIPEQSEGAAAETEPEAAEAPAEEKKPAEAEAPAEAAADTEDAASPADAEADTPADDAPEEDAEKQ